MSKHRLENLDFIRAIAIILVIYYHVTQMLIGNLFSDRALFYFGHHGVTIFFVLSGFLIGGIYYKKTEIKATKFWLSRFLRTYPPYFIMLIISWGAVYITRKEDFDFGYLLLLQNFYKEIPYFLVSWSLAVEEHFYLLFAILIFAIKNKPIQFYFWIVCLIAPPILRYFLYSDSGEFGFLKTASFLHIDSLASGVILSYIVHVRKFEAKAKKWAISLLLLITIFLCYMVSKHENIFTWSIGKTTINFAIACLLLFSYYAEPIKIAKTKFIKMTAIMAYSLYLVHPLIIHFSVLIFNRANISNEFIRYGGTLILIFITSRIFYVLIEQKSIKIRDRILNKI